VLTPEGAARIWAVVTEAELRGGSVVISDGEQTDAAPISEVRQDGGTLTVIATFDGGQANFEWKTRRVVTASGVTLDEAGEDGGRKVLGATWVVECEIELLPEA
jgi:hypothetical protein